MAGVEYLCIIYRFHGSLPSTSQYGSDGYFYRRSGC